MIYMDKNIILNKLYFDPSGFQSQQRLYKEAKQKDNTMMLKYVQEWYANKSKKISPKTNSFVAPHANDEYQSHCSTVAMWNDNPKNTVLMEYPDFPTYEYIEELANKINSFVSSK